jgi:hypothetical protein
MERLEEEERQREEEMREMDEQKKRAQAQLARKNAEMKQAGEYDYPSHCAIALIVDLTAPVPLKSCLKNGSPAGSAGSYGSTPSPQSQYEFREWHLHSSTSSRLTAPPR